MIDKVIIENYKSIQKLEIPLGRITVLIGANGSGKSNILEALAFGSASANDKLDNEFLTSRGIRVTDDPRFMRAAFDEHSVSQEIRVSVSGEDGIFRSSFHKNGDEPYAPWVDKGDSPEARKRAINLVQEYGSDIKAGDKQGVIEVLYRSFTRVAAKQLGLSEFLIYSPENTALRTFEQEGQIQPLGIKGEGLFKLLRVLSSRKNRDRLNEIKSILKLVDWFNDFNVSSEKSQREMKIRIEDKFLDRKLNYFDQKSSNEGFLFLIFYLCLFVSNDTPSFFAIDNIDASLNPKLCSQLIIELSNLAKKYNKQVIFTTHNPAILDGLNLDDEEQRLFVVYRNKLGHTKAKRVMKPRQIDGQDPLRLSEQFLRGYLGGLPKNF